ncbi:MAG: hypothetical protein WDN09_03805 [bacterium]
MLSSFTSLFVPFFHILNFVPFAVWLGIATFFLGYAARKVWLHYVQTEFISGIEWVLIEIIPPREVLRSPRAMELFFTNALYQYSPKGAPEMWWRGEVQLWFSLEIVSLEGQVHFFIRTPSRLKELIETQIYAQYPQAQVKVAEDYALAVPEISMESEHNLWGCEFKLEKPDAYPIKTYVDFGLDKDPKEEYKIDPISPVVELFGSLKKGEQMWLQIVITAAKKKYMHEGKEIDWVEEGHHILENISKPYTKDAEGVKEVKVPKWLESVVDGINLKTLKLGFECGIRFCYVAKKEAFNTNSKKNSRLIFHQYANPYLNQFGRLNSTSIASLFFAVPQKKILKKANKFLNEYRERSFFYPSLRHKLTSSQHSHTFILNTEELATLFHFPGQVLKVPTLERIESKEASPPTNLPI